MNVGGGPGGGGGVYSYSADTIEGPRGYGISKPRERDLLGNNVHDGDVQGAAR